VAVCANFQMMNRILDATGVEPPRQFAKAAEALGIASRRQ